MRSSNRRLNRRYAYGYVGRPDFSSAILVTTGVRSHTLAHRCSWTDKSRKINIVFIGGKVISCGGAFARTRARTRHRSGLVCAHVRTQRDEPRLKER